jgi:hypothetical protein
MSWPMLRPLSGIEAELTPNGLDMLWPFADCGCFLDLARPRTWTSNVVGLSAD